MSLQIRVCVELKFNATKYTDGKSPPSPACVEVRNGTNAHEILKLAATQDPCFNFTVKMTMWGNSVRSICGVHRRPADKVYWMIKIDGKSAKTGIDYLIPGDGSTLVFVYKQLFWRKWKRKPFTRIDLLGVKLIWFLCHIGTLHVDSHGSRQLNNVTYRKYISRRYAVILVLFKSHKLLIPCIRCQTH